ncbi:MAG TPA: alkaline phosphatase family protein [Pyrinomonadaceae bacterium]|nr:alkaline phosphatase family protein [Pyrinomonadaceae bacterium]
MQTKGAGKGSRQLVVGIDAMEWSLVEKWANEGKLPTFRRLIEQGARAELTTTAAQLPDTVWACIYTGTNPGKFEKFFYVQYDARKMGLRNVPDDEIRRTPFWDYMSAAGLRVGIADVAKFPLSKSINGFQFTNWGAHATKTARTSFPATLIQQVDARFGKHPVGDCDKFDAKPESLRELRRRVVDGVRAHGEVFRWLMREQQWDLFFAGFSAAHCIGHHFWHGVDPSHPRHEESIRDGFAETMEQVYGAIDREIGEMLALVDPDTRVMVVSGHGMGPIFHASWNLPEMLDLWGYGTKPASRVAAADKPNKAKVNPWRILKMIVPGPVQYAIKNRLPQFAQDQLLFLWYRGGKNWKGCRAFAIPNNDSVGAIRVSVKGRDRGGVVDPDDYQRVCRGIADALYELRDKEGGRQLVKKVTLTHETFHGPFLEQLPDLTVLWDQSFAWDTVYSPRFGTLQIKQQDARTGGHSSHGFVLMTGADIPAGVELPRSSIYDIAPTVLQAANVPIPEDMDGSPLPIHTYVTTA